MQADHTGQEVTRGLESLDNRNCARWRTVSRSECDGWRGGRAVTPGVVGSFDVSLPPDSRTGGTELSH